MNTKLEALLTAASGAVDVLESAARDTHRRCDVEDAKMWLQEAIDAITPPPPPAEEAKLPDGWRWTTVNGTPAACNESVMVEASYGGVSIQNNDGGADNAPIAVVQAVIARNQEGAK